MERSLNTLFGVKSHYEVRQRAKDRERQKSTRFGRAYRENNRKNTASRKTQYITYVDTTIEPWRLRTKCIKHDSN